MTKPVFIIAEAGVNHNGDIALAKKLILAAKEAGADAVKFQTYKTENLVSIYTDKAEYQKSATDPAEDLFHMLKKLELPYRNHPELKNYCEQLGIEFLSSPFDLESIDFLLSLGLKRLKIPSGEITNLPYLEKLGRAGLPLIASTGLATMDEINFLINYLTRFGTDKSKLTILHCNSEYPSPYEDINLRAMLTIRDRFSINVGYSDHSLGIEVSLAAATLGASVIEKHFTLDKNLPGPDHKASLEPHELKNLVTGIRHIEKALGSSEKKPSPSEEKNRTAVRKSLVAATDIHQGERLTEKNICIKRPGNGISPIHWNEVINQPAKRSFKKDELIEL